MIDKIINLAKTATAKNSYIVFMGNCLAAFLGMLGIVIISRKLGPSGFGAFSISFALLSLMANIGDLGFNFAVVREISQSRVKGEKEKQERIFLTIFWTKLVICLILGSLGLLFSNYITIKIFKSPTSLLSNRLVFSFLFLVVFYDLVTVFFQSNKRFKESVLLYILSNIIKLSSIILVYYLWPTFNNFIIFYILSPFIASIIMLTRVKIKIRFAFDREELKKLFKFSSWMGIAVILAAVSEQLNIFMVSAYLTNFATGVYSAAEKFVLPITLFTGALGTVLITRTSEFLELSHIKRFLKKVIFLQILLLPLFIIAVPFSKLVPFILGNKYLLAVPILQTLIIANFFRSATTPLNSLFYPLNKSIVFALDAFLQIILLFTLNRFFIVKYQAIGAAVSLVIVNLSVFIFNYLFLFYQLKKYEKKTLNLG